MGRRPKRRKIRFSVAKAEWSIEREKMDKKPRPKPTAGGATTRPRPAVAEEHNPNSDAQWIDE